MTQGVPGGREAGQLVPSRPDPTPETRRHGGELMAGWLAAVDWLVCVRFSVTVVMCPPVAIAGSSTVYRQSKSSILFRWLNNGWLKIYSELILFFK